MLLTYPCIEAPNQGLHPALPQPRADGVVSKRKLSFVCLFFCFTNRKPKVTLSSLKDPQPGADRPDRPVLQSSPIPRCQRLSHPAGCVLRQPAGWKNGSVCRLPRPVQVLPSCPCRLPILLAGGFLSRRHHTITLLLALSSLLS